MGLAPAWFVSAMLTEIEVRMFRSQPHGVGTDRRGERNKRSGELTTRRWTTGKVVCGLLASTLLPFSGVGLAVATAPAAHAAAGAKCETSLSSNDAWTHTGAWTSNDGGTTWYNANEYPSPDTLSRSVSNLPTSGAQFTFDWSWNWADTGGGSQQADVTLSYGGTVYATLHSPGPNASPRVASVAASNGASISPTTGPGQGATTTYTVTLPDGVASSGTLEFGMSTGTSEGGAGYVNNVTVGNIKASSTNCADLSISKYGPAAVQPNGSVDYHIYVTNNGPSAGDYSVTDQLPADLAGATTSTPGCSITSGTLTCTGTSLGVGSTATIEVQGTAPSTAGDTLANTASVTGTLPDPDTSDNTSGTVNTNVDDTLGGPLADPLVAGGTLGTAGLAFVGIAVRRRRAARVKV
ncbi:DUF11 domain-containing protein [Streptomyces sp. NPDC048506]|uniref:DUF11 domain-containing protein n=1 Tax=Streptomyces sp. NPDC048506 TaxID=3155028 RepID=UPI00341D62E4